MWIERQSKGEQKKHCLTCNVFKVTVLFKRVEIEVTSFYVLKDSV